MAHVVEDALDDGCGLGAGKAYFVMNHVSKVGPCQRSSLHFPHCSGVRHELSPPPELQKTSIASL